MRDTILSYLSWIDGLAGAIWVFLTVLFIISLVEFKRLKGNQNFTFKWGVFVIIMVWLYPIYTFTHDYQLLVGEIGNIFTLLITIVYFILLKKETSFKLSRLVIPQMTWLSIAIFYAGLMLISP
jgi:tryptophan-rich sensory protein